MREPVFPGYGDKKAMLEYYDARHRYESWVRDNYDESPVQGVQTCRTCGSLVHDDYIDNHTGKCIKSGG